MKSKLNFKKLLTATNILIVIFIVFYALDSYLPLPADWTGYTNWDSESPAIVNYIFGNCGGLLTHYLAMGVVGNEFYRHFTQMFLHGGLLHLIANAVGMYFIGNYTEKRFGWWLTPLLFIAIAFIESYITDPLYLAMVPSYAEEAAKSVSVGASGDIFGLIGVSLASLLFDIKEFKKIGKPTIIVSAIYGILPTYIIDFGWTTVCHNVAFILGLLIGAMIILPFYLLKKGNFARGNAAQENHTETSDMKTDDETD